MRRKDPIARRIGAFARWILFTAVLLVSFAVHAETPEQVDFLISGLSDSSGNQLAGGKVYTYSAGTTTNKTCWQDAAKAVAHANPIVLDAEGKKLVFCDGNYKFRIDNSSDVTQYTLDGLKFGLYNGAATYAGATTGSANAYVATLSPALLALVNGAKITFEANFTNTGAATLNVNSLGAIDLNASDDTALPASAIVSGRTYSATYETSTNAWLLDAPVLTLNGWTPAGETWVYASATTITVPSGAASKYEIGDKIWITNSGTKYFYITAVADTLLTVTGGSDYTVANAAITSPYYAHNESPVDFPQWFNYSPTLTGFSANPTNTVYQFKIDNGWCTTVIRHGTAGTSNATGFTITSPVTAKTISNGAWGALAWEVVNNGAATTAPAAVYISSGGTSFTLLLTVGAATTSWTNVNGKGVSFTISFPVI